ncbi:hypothetical protein [Blastococcus brunescens]|uniref:Tetratricopeptide repeat protein n=1 Tax=Blastococcus brunescens TaxID=1564165 RepID=A0ABZ1B8R1_9ACTN|nr:hypothetical protein [Blastococcus sp. BMG 8361]WRL65764.1 hypothetical protein U6N30_09390 [Blastococcus sp. BMG 8361]
MLNAEYGDADEAMTSVQRALACFDADDAHARGRAHRVLADVHLMREEIAEALVAGDAAISELAGEDDPVLLADVRREQANRLVVARRAEEGLSLFALARQAYDAHGLAVAAAGADLGRADALAALGRTGEAVAAAEEAAAVGVREDVPALLADALWTAASHSAPDPERYDRALAAYARAGAPEEQLDELRAARDAALKGGRRRFRFGR